MAVEYNSNEPLKKDLQIGDIIKIKGTRGTEHLLVTMLEEPKNVSNFRLGLNNVGCVEYNSDLNVKKILSEQHVSRVIGQNRILNKIGNIKHDNINI